ncbi:ATP-binding protein [Dictyobacter arantiisoli]|uniref:AAA+ ATPase domain-containing protein n=1 Tax=Dictyobacter arantiisoli TaxID=2014874 RepID=A0A5A5TG40_9CHLR|nr:ATP-binding protein [Dictyobacter arantiisoli]GCF09874.1 hypothetical protein KDI_34380 [Dictyobacter arantiisoli]
MERLNEIFDRTGSRQPLSEQRARTRTPHTKDSISSRRVTSDYQSRMKNKYDQDHSASTYQQQNPSLNARARAYSYQLQDEEPLPNRPEGRDYSEPVSRADPSHYSTSPTRRNARESGVQYQSQPQPHQDQQRIQPLQPRPTNNYYAPMHAPDDAYNAAPQQTDTMEEWESNGLGYGDWEKGPVGQYYYEKENEIEVFEEGPSTFQPVQNYRQRQPVEPEISTRGTRNLHDTRLASAIAAQQMTVHSRVTQPLNQQTISGIERERERGIHTRTSSNSNSTHAVPANYLKSVRQEAPVAPTPEITPSPVIEEPIPLRSICPKCKGAGYLRANVNYGHPNFGKPIPCDCKENERKEKRRQQLRGMSNMDAFHNQTFSTFSLHTPGVQKAFNAAIEFANNPDGWLVLIGPNGCGKTHLAASIANSSLDSGAVVLFEAVPDLLDHLRAAFAPTATEVYDQLFSKMREAELLVLDDLGSQQSSPWANEKLFQLLNYRYNLNMPTVVTANPKGLQGVDERIRSRLADIALVTTVSMDGARDYRPLNRKH